MLQETLTAYLNIDVLQPTQRTDHSQRNRQVQKILAKVDALTLKVSGPYRDAAVQLLAKTVNKPDVRASHAANCAKVVKDIKERMPNLASVYAQNAGDCGGQSVMSLVSEEGRAQANLTGEVRSDA